MINSFVTMLLNVVHVGAETSPSLLVSKCT